MNNTNDSTVHKLYHIWMFRFFNKELKSLGPIDRKFNGHDDSKSMYGETKSPVSVSDENVQANQDRVYFSICIYFLPLKNSLLTSDIHYL